MKTIYRVIWTALALLAAHGTAGGQTRETHTLTVTVLAEGSRSPLSSAVVSVADNSGKGRVGVSDSQGIAIVWQLPAGRYIVTVTHLGYLQFRKEVELDSDARLTAALEDSMVGIDEVVVTATESRGMTTSSVIKKDAMEHLQPSSFADILELLPGGSASAPSLSTPNIINLRGVSVRSSDYSTSALGTSFIIDGAPISTNANLHSISGAWQGEPSYSRNYINQGVDMRTISTDDIASVEIVRGIPSVEYGELTSGLVKIERKKGGRDLEARFKADMSSKLYYVGKGFQMQDSSLLLNVSLDLLDSGTDPRNNLENYKRLTGSARMTKEWNLGRYTASFNSNLDYGGSFDNVKEDEEQLSHPADKFRSSYNRVASGNNFGMRNLGPGAFRTLDVNASVSAEFNDLSQTRFVQLDRDRPAYAGYETGAHDGIYLPYNYVARHDVQGRPFNAFLKAVAKFHFETGAVHNEVKAGANWNMDKNYGKGQLFDPFLPVYPGMTPRARPYYDIPARHNLSFFAEDYSTVRLGRFNLSLMAGVRAETLLNLDRRHLMRGRFYWDPRANVKLGFPGIGIAGRDLKIELTAGAGWHTRFPTLSQLSPNPVYIDLVQLNYWNVNPDYRRLNLMTYVLDPSNYGLGPARNFKYEFGGDFAYNGNRLSVTWFREDMKSGFRSAVVYNSYDYIFYDHDQVDHGNLTGPPALEDIPSEPKSELRGYSRYTNGSRTLKQGVELTFSSQRIESIRTRVTVSGAWFRTTYTNTHEVYNLVSKIFTDEVVSVAGIYDDDTSYIAERLNTNFMFDTDIPQLGLRFSLSFQCMWYETLNNPPRNGTPKRYMDSQGVEHPFTEESASDPRLLFLITTPTDTNRRYHFGMDVNLKATKKLYRDRISLALFVNGLLAYYPDYVRNGIRITRSGGVTPYFGMEINFKL